MTASVGRKGGSRQATVAGVAQRAMPPRATPRQPPFRPTLRAGSEPGTAGVVAKEQCPRAQSPWLRLASSRLRPQRWLPFKPRHALSLSLSSLSFSLSPPAETHPLHGKKDKEKEKRSPHPHAPRERAEHLLARLRAEANAAVTHATPPTTPLRHPCAAAWRRHRYRRRAQQEPDSESSKPAAFQELIPTTRLKPAPRPVQPTQNGLSRFLHFHVSVK